MKHSARTLASSDEFMEAMSEAVHQPLLIIDTEFEKCNSFGEANVIGVSWGFPMGSEFRSYYAPFRHREFPTYWNLDTALIEEFNRFPLQGTQVYHNWQADHNVLLKDGIDFSNRNIMDTMVMAHLVDENELSYGLDYLARKKFKARKKSLTDLERLVGWEHIHPIVMGEYACTDVYLTYRLYVDVLAGLQHQSLDNLYEDYQRFIKVLFKVIQRGLHIDVDLAKQFQDEGRTELDKLAKKYEFNLASQQKVAHYLHNDLGVPVRYVTAKGGPSTSSMHLRRYTTQYPEASGFTRDVLRFRTVNKAVATWYEGFVTRRGVDGLLHPGLTIVGGGNDDTGGTKTGRLSCREPNLQQVPRVGNVRKLFKSPPGYKLIELDYSQAELRLTGWYMSQMGDDTVVKAYAEKQDIHSITAERMGLTAGLPYKEARQVGKTCNFSLCYRAGPSQLRMILYRDANLDVTESQAARYHAAWHGTYPVVRKLNEAAEKRAMKMGYVRMWNDRRRHLVGNDTYKAYNSIIQGGVGQIMVAAMTQIGEEFPNILMVNQVHDSIWFYLPEDTWEQEAKKLADLMAEIPTKQFGMPFEVDFKEFQ